MEPRVVGRYTLFGEIAAGGMATVHYGRLLGPVGFSRTVAIKRLHAQHARDPEFAAMFLDEARLAARIRHPNVVPTLDVVAQDGELFLVMDYVQGESLAKLIRASNEAKAAIPTNIVSTIVCGMLLGLHAAHEATDEHGEPLHIVHRDVSPQNVIVGSDGIPRVLDFGVAKAAGRMQTTREGQIKGKLSYMAPEQLNGLKIDRRVDVYASGVVLWETLTRRRLFTGESEGEIVTKVVTSNIDAPSKYAPSVPPALDAIALKALRRDPAERYQTARDMARDLEDAVAVASATRVAEWVEGLAHEVLAVRARSVAQIESESGSDRIGADEPTKADVSGPVTSGLSGVSSISVSTNAMRKQLAPASHKARWIVLGLIAAASTVFVVTRLPRNHVAPSTTQSTAPSIAMTASATTSEPVASEVPSAKPAPTATATARKTITATTTTTTHAAVTATATTAAPQPTASAEPKCTVTSYLDESGIKHFKQECK
jgi:serine/threonine-protein kinase